jgi:hypothetical protein
MDAVYRLEGARALTSPLAGGPWDAGMQHGSAPASLIATVAESVPAAQPMRVARMTVDLMRPVPIAPLDIAIDIVREGRKIQLCDISLSVDGVRVVRGSVLRVRRTPVDLPDTVAQDAVTLPGPEAGRVAEGKITANPFLGRLEMSVVKGGFNKPGPGAVWFRVAHPIVDAHPTTPPMRAAIAADFCNGVSSVLDFRSWTFINGDLTLSLARDPVGEWILLDAETWLGPDGGALACGRLADAQGYFGRAVQSVLIEPRAGRGS